MKKSKLLVLVLVLVMVLTIGLTACGGKEKTITTVVDGQELVVKVTGEDFKLTDAVKEGYEFKGWFTDENLTNAFDLKAFTEGKEGKIKIYAKLEKITYIKVNAKDATCTKAGNKEYYIGNNGKKYLKDGEKYTLVNDESTLVLPKVALVEVAEVPAQIGVDGVKKHWKCPVCNKLYKTNEAKEDNIATAEYLRIPALEKRTITFNSNGGSEVADIVVAKGTIISAPQTPTKTGHTFVGWFSDEALSTAYIFGKLENDATLYAKWQANTYSVSFVSDDVTILDVDLVYGENYGELPTPDAKTGFRFEGWYTDKVAGEKVLDNLDYLLDEDCTLYARWTEKTDPTLNFNSQAYEITYNGKAFDTTGKYTTNSDSSVVVSYYKGSTKLANAPKDAGTYIIKIAVAETNNFKAKETSVNLIIKKVVLTSTTNIAKSFYHNKDGSATFNIELYKTDFESMVEDSIVVEVTTPSGNVGEYKNITITQEIQNYDVSQLNFDITLEHNYQLKITEMPTLSSTGLADNRCLVCDELKDTGVVIPSINDGVNTKKYKYVGSVEKAPTMDAVGYIVLNVGRYERFELPNLTDANYIKEVVREGNLVDASLVNYYIGGETNKILVAENVQIELTEVSDIYGLVYKKSDKQGKAILFDYRGNAKQIRIPSTIFSGAQFNVEITDGVNPVFTKANVNGLESIIVPDILPNGNVFEANSNAEPYNINLYYNFTNPDQTLEEYYTAYGTYGLSTYYFSENMPIPTDITEQLPVTISMRWHYSNTGVAVSWGTFVKVDVTNGAVLYRYDDTTKTAYLVKATITATNTDLSIYDRRTFGKGKIADKFIFCADAFDDCKQNLRTLELAINSKISDRPNYEAPVIEEFAFSGCANLTTVNFNKEAVVVEDEAFSNCPKLEKITVNNINKMGADTLTFGRSSANAFKGANANLKIYLKKVPVTTLDAWKAVKTSVAGSKMYLYSEDGIGVVPDGFDGYYKNSSTGELWQKQ